MVSSSCKAKRGDAMQVTDLSQVLHMVGGTAASYMIFFLPGMLLLNAAIVKRTASMADLEIAEVSCLAIPYQAAGGVTFLAGVVPGALRSSAPAPAQQALLRAT